jgi:hypothetical protein
MRLPTILSAVFAIGLMPFFYSSQANQPNTSRYDQLNWEKLGAHSGGNVGLWLDLMLMRNDPAVLKTPTFMKYFIALNNCSNPTISNQFYNEFDYPQLSAYYASHAAEILSRVPNTMTVGYGGYLAGTYDFAAKSFPIVDGSGKKASVDISHFVVEAGKNNPTRNMQTTPCNVVNNVKPSLSPDDPDPGYNSYNLILDKSFSFTSIPLDESAARDWAQRANNSRREFFYLVDIEIPDQHPKVGVSPRSRLWLTAEFTAHVKKVTVVDGMQHPLAVVYQP